MGTTYTVTHDFTADTTAVADHVDANFTDILTAINALDAGNLASGTVAVARISNLTSTQMASAFFKDEDAMTSDSATAVASQQSVKAYVDAAGGHDGDGYAYYDVDGTKTKVYTKYLTGTTDADATTTVAHSVTSGLTKILSVSGAIYSTGAGGYLCEDMHVAATPATAFRMAWDDTNITISTVGSMCQGQTYKIRIDYIL